MKNLILFIWLIFLHQPSMALDGYERGGLFPSHLAESDLYTQKVQPILDRRCVVCHACFEAPCQLKLTSPEMILRGASPHATNGGTLSAAPRTDLMLTLKEQREGGFFPVLSNKPQDSILLQVLVQGSSRDDRPKETYVAPDKRMCVSSSAQFAKLDSNKKKSLGMPYYMASLSSDELQILTTWIAAGSPLPSEEVRAARAVPRAPKVIQEWENFFNTRSWKGQWTSRYLYEHLFTAHLYFEESPGEFYELVRSSTEAPVKIQEIASPRPFDMPSRYANNFFYRLRKVQSTIVYKQHFVYKITSDTMDELKQLFWAPKWIDESYPKPFNFIEKNPFAAFSHIPADSRYRWMLKNAKMLLDMDMRSDNCHGEGATGPLRDSFLILFVKPESDVSAVYEDYFKKANRFLRMANVGSTNVIMNTNFKKFQFEYSKVKQAYQQQHLPNGFSFEDIWDGEQGTQQPLFTINRHEKTVSVHDGAWGPQQRVSLLFDYVSFERLYYNCVALTTLYDSLFDKMGTVLYLRDVGREAEEQMLSFIPEEFRPQIREEWIQGLGAKNRYDDSRFALKFNPELISKSGLQIDSKRPFASMMDFMLLKSGRYTLKNIGPNHYPISTGSDEYLLLKELSNHMSQKASVSGKSKAHFFPNVSYLAVKEGRETRYYTIIANRFYDYINFLPFDPAPADKLGRNPARDWMTIYPGIQANYPGKIFMVSASNVKSFVQYVSAVNSPEAYTNFDKVFGLQKMSAQFWPEIDRLQSYFIQSDNINHGSLELGEYGVHDLIGSP